MYFSTLGYWPFSQFLCDLWNMFDYILCTVSVYTILFISIDRYLSLKHPLSYQVTILNSAKNITMHFSIFLEILKRKFLENIKEMLSRCYMHYTLCSNFKTQRMFLLWNMSCFSFDSIVLLFYIHHSVNL